MLRFLVVALLLANALFFAWTRGWLAPGLPPPTHGEREPERVAAQVLAERVTVLPAAANGTVCLEAGPFSDTTIAAAQSALEQVGLPAGSWSRVAGAAPGQFWLRVERANAPLREKLLTLAPAAYAGGFAACVKPS